MRIDEVAQKKKKYYHVSPTENEESILRKGLVPSTGPRSGLLDEEKGIFLFPTFDDMDNALMNWLGEEYDEEGVDGITIFEVLIPEPEKLQSDVGYEVFYSDHIPPENISVLYREEEPEVVNAMSKDEIEKNKIKMKDIKDRARKNDAMFQ